MAPRVAIVSAARASPFHPHPETIERLRRVGARIWVTGRDGALRARLGPDGHLELRPGRAAGPAPAG